MSAQRRISSDGEGLRRPSRWFFEAVVLAAASGLSACGGGGTGAELFDAGRDAGNDVLLQVGGSDDGGRDGGAVDGGLDGGREARGDAGTDAGHRRDGTFCEPCVSNSDCGQGGFCLGDVGHCGLDCSHGEACPTGSTCQHLNAGKAPLATQCVPTASACGARLGAGPQVTCVDTWAGYGDAWFGTNCRSCHRHDTAFLSAAEVRSGREGIRVSIDARMMPAVVDAGLSEADRRRLFVYLACGAP
ncbi:MAG: hypothetical protein K1X89_22420 [Myxococcaceae bacterium]|nr:hypothetical protein [Myxococcaceae bacterium]